MEIGYVFCYMPQKFRALYLDSYILVTPPDWPDLYVNVNWFSPWQCNKPMKYDLYRVHRVIHSTLLLLPYHTLLQAPLTDDNNLLNVI